jgi:transposase
VEKTLPDGVNLKNVVIGFQDESRIGQQGSTTRMWTKQGTRPCAIKQKQFISANIFGVVCPNHDSSFALVLPRKDTEMIQLFLDEFSKIIPRGKHVALVVDRAGWHITQNLNIPKNISFVLLPPYSPELNPIEQLWQQLKQRYLANRCFKNYKEILSSVSFAWKEFTGTSGAIKNLCSRSWASVVI